MSSFPRSSIRVSHSLLAVGLAVVLTLGGTNAQAQAPAVNLVASGEVDLAAGTVTLPLHQGRMASGENVWHVLLDVSDRDTAERLGINWSGKLANTEIGRAVRDAEISPDGELVFDAGTVDFAPVRRVEPGPGAAPFPPSQATPGSVGDDDYTPLVRVTNGGGHIFNAPVVAFDVEVETLDEFCRGAPDHALLHDKVVHICPRDGTVTLALTSGFSGGKRIEYISSEASVALVAALEGATFTPRLSDVPANQGDAVWSAVEPIYVVINGQTGETDPARQGLTSALADGLPPLNITGDVPTLGDGYSPLWASHPVFWAADNLGQRRLITGEAGVHALEAAGLVHGPGGGVIGSDGILVNCPVIARRD
ncbi:MAG: hypothetical protein HOK98_11680 [Rhodospirillaceae bacterium]|jgi:hypothetical protein|nr:hypothetical protein [Rhodospirillaceae bacterium]MBT5943105.1 hypothetical protein [Rhodospirillaceae bacterium]MBT6404891.1 hypothetical protein [Rhodospirillaceae bacterium]MBT6536831.1 hypothetical protein [Rhodospirillaceae bacterium]MBT7360651.1 hypothetical protein [Rhodospirillaceae bacterium]